MAGVILCLTFMSQNVKMKARHHSMALATLWTALILFTSVIGFAQSTPPTVLHASEAAKLLPDAVFFRGQSATVQTRNSGGIHFADDMFVLVALVDNSGYSSGIQQKYQAYFITEVPLDFNGNALKPGAYGVGIVKDHFIAMDIGAHDLFTVPIVHDADLKRPSPLQLNADGDHYRLYFGRDYVTFAQSK